MNLAHNMEFDVAVRAVGALSNPYVPAYTAVDARLGWRPSKDLEIHLTGANLLDPRHVEFASGSTGGPSEMDRSVQLGATWNF